jgi:Asp-tRNA(Asn)/Glu-tRNA(Gln) amidotransferase A subunit family amidase
MTSATATEQCFLTATEALDLFRQRHLSPVELLLAQRAQLEACNPRLNAIRSTRWEAALAAAQLSEQRYMGRGEAPGVLEGVTTLLKNEHGLIGEETDQGSLLCAGEIDTENAPIVQRLLDAGAVIPARTHVPEFYMANFTRSVAHGVTRNPWNLAITCGGSSGGSGAALAAGMACLSTASDIGGSIRVPAAYCGVVGFKASYGRVPEAAFHFAVNTFNHNGLMCRSVADAALMFNVINGPHRSDPSTLRPKLELPVPLADVRGLRIALSMDLGYFDVDPQIQANTRRVADMLREAGAIVDEVRLKWNASAGDAYTNALVFGLGRSLAGFIAGEPPERVSDYVRTMAAMVDGISVEAHLGAVDTIGQMHAALQDVFDHHDIVLCPTLARNDLVAEGLAEPHPVLLRDAMTYPFNMLSRHPVLAVPTGFSSSGVPTGVQIVGRTFDEPTVMRVGAVLEQGVGWRQWRPPVAPARADAALAADATVA